MVEDWANMASTSAKHAWMLENNGKKWWNTWWTTMVETYGNMFSLSRKLFGGLIWITGVRELGDTQTSTRIAFFVRRQKIGLGSSALGNKATCKNLNQLIICFPLIIPLLATTLRSPGWVFSTGSNGHPADPLVPLGLLKTGWAEVWTLDTSATLTKDVVPVGIGFSNGEHSAEQAGSKERAVAEIDPESCMGEAGWGKAPRWSMMIQDDALVTWSISHMALSP